MSIRSLIPLALLVLGALQPVQAQTEAPTTSSARKPHPARAAFPELSLADQKSQGQRALKLLGKRVDEVAKWYGKSPEEFRSMMLRDRHLRLDGRGRLFVEDELLAPLGMAATPAEQSVNDGSLLPLDQTFLLHSRPGAKRTLYLNFKGATLTNTAWTGSNTVTALPFDLDGLPYSNSTAELQRIQGIWQRVAEDFAPFDVNVTTEAPSAAALTRSGSTDQVFGTTVLITKSTGVYSCSCGGVAYVGVFDDTTDYYKPALVFYNNLGGGNEKYVAEAISHEAGHNMGLNHDGTSSTGYYTGHGSGATGWAPIMGVGYYQALVQWSKGQYSGANNTQDDFVVMAANGVPLRDDDHGNTAGTATAMTAVPSGGLSVFEEQGVVERAGDVDMFSFNAAAGAVAVSLSPAGRAPNLDALIQLRNSAGTVLATANPADGLAASLSFTVPSAGTYFVSVTGTGKGDPLTIGYSSYGSLGNYALQVTAGATQPGSQPPTAALTATPTSGTAPLTTTMSAAGSTDPDGSIVSYAWTFGDGSTATGSNVSHVYTAAGTYTAQVTVTDNMGLTATRSVSIQVNPVVAAKALHVDGIAMSLLNSGTSARARAVVKVVDATGKPLSSARVYGQWSGVISGSSSGYTNSAGEWTATSGYTRNSGTFTFTVTNITATGYAYDSAANVEVSDSITRSGAQPPTAALTATPTSGTAPLTTTMSAAGSTDPDGSIVSYAWTFGDGSTATGANVSHVYTTPGTYTAQVTVTDNMGLTATRNVSIQVNPGVASKALHVDDIAMSLLDSGTSARARAVVKVVDAAGKPLSRARVYGQWSGAISGSFSGYTNSAGQWTATSGYTRNRGTFTFTVTNITASGYVYDSAANVEVSDSITR